VEVRHPLMKGPPEQRTGQFVPRRRAATARRSVDGGWRRELRRRPERPTGCRTARPDRWTPRAARTEFTPALVRQPSEPVPAPTGARHRRNASAGSRRAALAAGYMPATQPTNVPTRGSGRIAAGVNTAVQWRSAASKTTEVTARHVPAIPPILPRTIDSQRNWAPTFMRVAPSARRTPIS
jgi:hypothetical protein